MSVQIQKKRKKGWLKELVEELRRLIEVLEYDTIHVKHAVGKRILPLYREGKIKRGTIRKIADGIGWSRIEVHRCIKFARKYRTPEDAINELLPMGYTLTWHNVHTFLLPDERKPTPPLPEGSFEVIYADPPWKYEVDYLDASPNSHYPTMTTEVICKLEIPTSENAVLFLWATNPMLHDALEVMEAWGFQYVTNMVWVKDKSGLGFWFRGQHELLLVGVKGNVHHPEESSRFPSVLHAPVKGHSEKPDETYNIIEAMYPNARARKIELFARKKREGWTAWGLEVQESG